MFKCKLFTPFMLVDFIYKSVRPRHRETSEREPVVADRVPTFRETTVSKGEVDRLG